MKLISFLKAAALACVLTACGGGGGDAGSPPFGGGTDPGGGTTTASDLTLVLDEQSLSNAGGETLVATATAVDANRNALSGIAVTLSVDSNATMVVSGSSTNDAGEVTGTVSVGSDKSNRVVRVTARSGSLERTATFSVVGVQLQATAVPSQLAPGASGEVQYRVLDANSAPMSEVEIRVTGPDGTETVSSTDVNGRYDFDYTAPSSGSGFDVTATAAGVVTVTSVVVQTGSGTTPPADGIIRSASISSNPTVVSVNSDSSSNQSEIRALFIGDENKPIQNVRVRFDLNGDANSIGGTLSSAAFTVLSDSSGIARTAYRPGSRSSPVDGVTVRACYKSTDFTNANDCPNSVLTRLTVVSDPLSVSIGTNNLLEVDESELTYIQRFAVQVVDSSGQAKSGVTITPLLDLQRYYKGFYVPVEDGWARNVQQPTSGCLNEDLNRNGISETYSNGFVEDANGSFELTPGRSGLEPRKADVTISFEGSSVTDASGKAILKIEYPKNIATWVYYNITVTASGVGGTEGRSNFSGLLAALASDSDDPAVSPPFQFSPYGTDVGDPRTFALPDGSSVQLCTNPN